jgi:putative ABC transport system permease protein
MNQTIKALSALWSKYFPEDPFDYYFLDDKFAQQYKADIQFGTVFGIFAVLAIFIACFGLLGLSSYNVLQRTKEIGIRKILGASLSNIFMLLSKDFIRLIVIALILAIPASWILMNHWLSGYAYRIGTSWWIFGVSGALTLLVAVITISVQILKAVAKNPVKSLERE